MSRIMVNLEKAGRLEKRPCDNDARASILALTESGTSMMKRLMPVASKIYDGIIADLGVERYRQLLSVLRNLAKTNS